MGLLDKIAFWKHKEETYDLPEDVTPPSFGGTAPPEQPAEPTTFRPPEPSFGIQPIQQPFQPPNNIEKDLQVINAKLDTIKAQLETLNTKLDKTSQKEPWR